MAVSEPSPLGWTLPITELGASIVNLADDDPLRDAAGTTIGPKTPDSITRIVTS